MCDNHNIFIFNLTENLSSVVMGVLRGSDDSASNQSHNQGIRLYDVCVICFRVHFRIIRKSNIMERRERDWIAK